MKKTTISAIAAVSVAGALVVGLGAVTSWFTNWNPKTWFGRGGHAAVTPVDPVTPVTPSTVKDGAVVTIGDNNGISLLSAKLPRAAYAANGVSEQSDTAYTLTATVSPENATNKAVDWSIAWLNADSAWATCKTVTDYVTVTPNEDGATVAVVECKKDFGERIVITCTSRDNAELSATCTVDYTQKILSGTVNGMIAWGGASFTLSEDKVVNMYCGGLVKASLQYPNDALSYAGSKINTTAYTIADEYTWTLEFNFSRAVFEYLRGKGYSSLNNTQPVSFNVFENGNYFVGSYTNPSAFSGCMRENELKQLCGNSEIYKTQDFYDMVGMDFVQKTDGLFTITSTITGTHSTYTTTYKATLSQAKFKVAASDVTIDNGNIIF